MCRGKNIPSGCVLSDYWNLASDYCPPMIPVLFLRKSLTWDRDQAPDCGSARAETGGDFSLALEMTGRGPARADNLSLARGELYESSMKSSSDLHNSVV